MPLYDYKCDSCGNEFEILRSRTDESPVKCPECKEEAEKVLSGFAIGSGGGVSLGSSLGGGCSSSGGG